MRLATSTRHAVAVLVAMGSFSVALTSCGGLSGKKLPMPSPHDVSGKKIPGPAPYEYDYIVGPGDSLSIFVWRNQDLSRNVVVRPDGKFSTPLVEDLLASGKTPTQLAREIEVALSRYIRDPLVTVMVGNFQGVLEKQVRVVGEAANPQALPYRSDMTILDVMIAVGGLTEFAAGNRAKLVRAVDGRQLEIRVRLEDLVRDGDMTANVRIAPGDILIIPEAWF